MILIADSGSTKTDWRFVDAEKQITPLSTTGINPFHQDEEAIVALLKNELLPQLSSPDTVLQIYFYGAGCKTIERKEQVRNALAKHFSKAQIQVESDLLAAARALFGNGVGIAAILGTGSNSCYFANDQIVLNRRSLGYILGDEGSGAYLGKLLVAAVLNEELSLDLRNRFFERFQTDPDTIIDQVYRKPLANRYLASFSKFIFQNLKDPEVHTLAVKAFGDFFDKQVCQYPDYQKYPLGLCGSVAFYYSNIIRALAEDRGIRISTILESPIAGLTIYHVGE